MKPSRPYLIRALYQWIVDNDCTPHLQVNAAFAGVQVPADFVSNGQIILNISPNAIRQLNMNNDAVTFEGRFAGVAHSLYVPISAVMAIYARENGQGMVFDMASPPDESALEQLDGEPLPPEDEPPRPSGRPSLKVIK